MGFFGDADLSEPFLPFATLRERLGFIPGLFRAQLAAPAVIQAEIALLETALLKKATLSRIQKECILLALAAAQGNRYCAAWHYQTLVLLGVPEGKLDQILQDHRDAGLQPVNTVLLDFARRIGYAGTPITGEDLAALEAVGLAGRPILEAVQVSALGGFLQVLAKGLSVEPDFGISSIQALSRGRTQGSGVGGEPYTAAIPYGSDDLRSFAFLREHFGSIPSIFRLQISTPEVLDAEVEAIRVMLGAGGALRREQKVLAQLAVSLANEDAYQASLCDAILSRLNAQPDSVRPTEAETVLMQFVCKLVDRHQEWSVIDAQALRHAGFSETQILEAVAAAALANFFNVLRLGLGVAPEITLPSHLQSLQSAISQKKAHLLAKESRQTGQALDTDADCVARVKEGDLDAFEELMNRHHRRVFRALIGILGDPDEARDAMQDTFLKVFQHLHGFEGRSKFSTWLLSIASNTAIQRLRERMPAQSLDQISADFEDIFRPRHLRAWSINPEELYSQTEMRELIERGITRLPAKYRVVLMLRDIEQIPIEEAAAALGLGIAATKARLLRGRLMLREALAPHFALASGEREGSS